MLVLVFVVILFKNVQVKMDLVWHQVYNVPVIVFDKKLSLYVSFQEGVLDKDIKLS